MGFITKTLGLIIIAGSFIAAITIIGKNIITEAKNQEIEVATETEQNNDLVAEISPPVNQPSENIAEAKEQKNEETASIPVTSEKKDTNYTEYLASELVRSMKEQGFAGNSPIEIQKKITSLSPEEFTDLGFTEKIKSFGQEEFSPKTLDLSFFKIIETTPSSLEKYRTDYEKIILNDKFGIFFDVSKNPKPEDLPKAIESIAKTIKELTALPIPAKVAPYHAKYVSFLLVEQNILSAISDIAKDPMRALLALQAVPEVTSEFSEARKNLEKTYRS